MPQEKDNDDKASDNSEVVVRPSNRPDEEDGDAEMWCLKHNGSAVSGMADPLNLHFSQAVAQFNMMMHNDKQQQRRIPKVTQVKLCINDVLLEQFNARKRALKKSNGSCEVRKKSSPPPSPFLSLFSISFFLRVLLFFLVQHVLTCARNPGPHRWCGCFTARARTACVVYSEMGFAWGARVA